VPGPIIKTGDMVVIIAEPPALAPMLMVPTPLVGTSPDTLVMGMPICLEGDQIPPEWRVPTPYTAPPFVVPGVLTVTEIITIPGVNTTELTENGRPILIEGGEMEVILTVETPAQLPPPVSTPDPLVVKAGTATFITTNMIVMGG
jgi:hypothetical protein